MARFIRIFWGLRAARVCALLNSSAPGLSAGLGQGSCFTVRLPVRAAV